MKKKRVLLIDDAMDYRILLSKAFKEEGYQVFLARDGIEAYVKFFRINPDVIILDVLLPKMRGDILLKWLKGTPRGKNTPVLVVSGHIAMKDYLYELGIELFFEKPCPVKYVLLAAKEIVDINKQIRELNQKLRQMKARFDYKTFRTEHDIKEDMKTESSDYKVCGHCHRGVSVTTERCPRCGSSNIVTRFGE